MYMYLNEVIMKKSKAYQPELIESLRNPRETEKYLNVALEENDPELFLLALRKCDGSTRRCSAAS
jgi:DNA-binding phage protein